MRENTTVMAFGAFDGIHTGHLHYLKKAKSLGSRLIVVISRDKSKWKYTKNCNLSEDERADLVKALHIADEVILGSQTSSLEKVKLKKPDILAITVYHGVDKSLLTGDLQRMSLNAKVVEIQPYNRTLYDRMYKQKPF